MRVHVLSVLTVCGLWSMTAVGIVQAQGVNVDVNKGGVGVEVGGKERVRGEGHIVRVKDLTGLSVYNASDESLGKIEDLAIDPQAAKIRYAVLSFGGILGMGDKYFAIPWRQLSFVSKGETSAGTQKEDHCVLDVPKETLKNAPGFDKDNWPNFADNKWRQTVDKYYGKGVHVDAKAGGVDVEVGAEGMERGGSIVRAKDLTGLSVYNASDESLGKIEDLVVAPQAGRIRYAVLSFGGILGIGDKYFAIPWQKLSFVSKGETSSGTQKESHCVLDVPKETLKNAPGFNKDNWPNFADNNWHQTVDQYYRSGREASGERRPQR
jgi:sporulation protein YlmC with PRC-barrel domain